jgi:hypothetical protein
VSGGGVGAEQGKRASSVTHESGGHASALGGHSE